MAADKLTILLVEDDDPIRDCLGDLFTAAGHSVYLCSTRMRAESLLRHGGFNFVLTDGMFPEDDLTGNVRAWGIVICVDAAVRGIPVILMTGDDALAERGERYGFKVVKKPFSLTALLEMVKEQVEAEKARMASAGGE